MDIQPAEISAILKRETHPIDCDAGPEGGVVALDEGENISVAVDDR